MGKYDVLRSDLQTSQSALANHSMNQRTMKRTTHGERRLHPNNKELRSEAKRAKKDEAEVAYTHAKIARISEHVIAVLHGWDDVTPQAFNSEVRFLERMGVSISTVVAMDSEH
jgi:hypothetical protein